MQPEDWSSAEWSLPNFDVDVPNSARIYDWLLGGGHNFAVDRELGKRLVAAFPNLPDMARASRIWLRRAVRVLVEEHGVDQFLDLGSGLPSMGYTHEVAQAINPDVRVVYVDNDAIAVSHSHYVTENLDRIRTVEADFTLPAAVLTHPDTVATLDFDRPIAVIFSHSLHLLTDDDDPWGVVANYRDATAPGSFLVISHHSLDHIEDIAVVNKFTGDGSHPFVPRTHDRVLTMFDGYRMLPPGLCYAGKWRPEQDQKDIGDAGCYCGVGVRG